MTFAVQVSDDRKYLIGKSEEPITRSVAIHMMAGYVNAIEETGITRILSDVRGMPNVMGAIDDYEYAYSDAEELKFPRGVRAAVLIDVGDRSHDFAETVATNAGYQVRVFESDESALAWLTSDAPV